METLFEPFSSFHQVSLPTRDSVRTPPRDIYLWFYIATEENVTPDAGCEDSTDQTKLKSPDILGNIKKNEPNKNINLRVPAIQLLRVFYTREHLIRCLIKTGLYFFLA